MVAVEIEILKCVAGGATYRDADVFVIRNKRQLVGSACGLSLLGCKILINAIHFLLYTHGGASSVEEGEVVLEASGG